MSAPTHEMIDMSPIYMKYPLLEEVENFVDPRFERRRAILYHAPRNKRGAEIGVFTGQFSEMLVDILSPTEFHAIDPWFSLYGDYFPNWGEYSAHGKLETRAGYEAAIHRTERFKGVNVVAKPALEWIETVEPGTLDWVYVDSTHQYESTLAELNALANVLADDGVILGDDCWPNRAHHHYGVYRAVRDFVRANNFEMLEIAGGQWAARRSID